MTARKQIKSHKRLNTNVFNLDKTNTMHKFSAHVAFNKVTNGQTDIKHDNNENFAQRLCQWIVLKSFPSGDWV